jgi:hypothetical protein
VNERTQGKNSDVSGVISPKGNGKQTRPRSRLLASSDFQNLLPIPSSRSSLCRQRRMKESVHIDVIPTKLRASAYKNATLLS